jgi:hypothetical protein
MDKPLNRPADTGNISRKQALFARYFTATLIDLVVIGLLNEYWSRISVDSFTVALLAAMILQLLLKVSIALEHKAAAYFKKKGGPGAKTKRLLAAWLILFISKLIILWAIDVAFGNSFIFHGMYHGLIPFLVLITIIITAETLAQKFFLSLGDEENE